MKAANLTDEERERQIEQRYQWLMRAPTGAARRVMWSEYRKAINGRSKDQIERMERERGLR